MALSRMLQATTVAAALTLALSACGSGDDGDAADKGGSGPDAAASSPAPDDSPAAGDDASDDTSDDASPSGPVQFRRVLEATGIPADGAESTPLPEDCSDVPAGQPKAGAETIACDESGIVYRLAPAEITGGVESAEAEKPANLTDWVVSLRFDAQAATAFGTLTRELAGTNKLLAIVLDGEVISAPTIQDAVEDGRVQIGGTFTEEQATTIAGQLTKR